MVMFTLPSHRVGFEVSTILIGLLPEMTMARWTADERQNRWPRRQSRSTVPSGR
jgi:hypothetical protein